MMVNDDDYDEGEREKSRRKLKTETLRQDTAGESTPKR